MSRQALLNLSAVAALCVFATLSIQARGAGQENMVVVRDPHTGKLRKPTPIGMMVADNQPGDVSDISGSDPSITIPSVRITQAAGLSIKAALQRRSRTRSGVVAILGVDPNHLAGTDSAGRILLYTPSVLEPGSSVSHYTTEAKPNQLMEPAINDDRSHQVTPPRDLTYPLLQDIGW